MVQQRAGHTSYEHRSRGEKLGVKPGQAVLLVGVRDEYFITELQQRGARITRTGAPDVIFCLVESRAALARLPELATRMKRDGALWTIRPKGSPAISEGDVMKAGKAAGLVDVKVVRFSDTHTAEKFVVPRKVRGAQNADTKLTKARSTRDP
jgi:hypothetical protein